ncbi:MAG TPA: PEP-CTERM sorting domain-containing protein [Micropepsaceae bacterium]|nr:PEP-CTERM sorting domain-containing protein [Micropepsaceae bacterium]
MAIPTGLNGPIASYGAPFGSSHDTTVENFLDSYYGISGVSFLGRLDSSGADFTGSPLSGLGATLVGTGLTSTSGAWTLTEDLGTGPAWNVLAIEISAASQALVYDENPAGLGSAACSLVATTYTCTGNWNTNDIIVGHDNHPALSHIDFYGIDPPTNPVPEPATLALFGTGLAGLLVGRRRKAKAAI